jgi:isocitrate lyase
MGVPGIVVARTDAEAASLLDGRGDERDQPFILGATSVGVPSYKVCMLGMMKSLREAGLDEINGHLLYSISDQEYEQAAAWLERTAVLALLQEKATGYREGGHVTVEGVLDEVGGRLVDAWESEAGLDTYGESVAEVMEFRIGEGESFEISPDAWRRFASTASLDRARSRAKEIGITITWDPELAKTPEGYYQIRGGIPYAVAKSLASAPFADILWMETKTADLDDARQFADAIHAVFPDKMLAYNLSPSFNWDTTGMSDDDMRRFPEQLAKLGFVFNFITYGGHQIDGVAAEEFATALKEDGMLALARLQRKIRLVDSPYRTPQTLVGGPRLDGALAASSGRTATTRAMGRDSTQHQHLVQTEVPKALLEGWLAIWTGHYGLSGGLRVELLPQRAGSELLELSVRRGKDTLANVIFAPIVDRRERTILSVHDQNTFDEALRKKRLMTLVHLFLVHRYKAQLVHYVSPTEDNRYQTSKMKVHGIFREVSSEIGDIIVADVNAKRIVELLEPDGEALKGLIEKRRK